MHEILCELNVGVQEGNKYADGVTTCIYIHTLICIHTHAHAHTQAISLVCYPNPLLSKAMPCQDARQSLTTSPHIR